MTTDDLDVKAILERAEAATPGPWVKTRQEGAGGYVWVDTRADVPEGEACILEMQNTVQDEADAAFIAAARTDVPALCAEVERLRGEVAELTESNADLDSTCSSMVSARDLMIRDLRFDLRLLRLDRDSGNEALAASAEALRVEREAHAALSEKHNTWCRTADGKALQEAYEEGLATDSAALEREQARVRELTADNERLRAALKAATETFSEVTHVDGLPHDARVVALRGWQESARAELAPTPTGGTEHE